MSKEKLWLTKLIFIAAIDALVTGKCKITCFRISIDGIHNSNYRFKWWAAKKWWRKATHNRLSRKKTQTTHRMLGMLIFKKSIKFGIRKKILRRGKVQSLLDLSLSKEI